MKALYSHDMKVSEFQTTTSQKNNAVNRLLESRYGLSVSSCDQDSIELYQEKVNESSGDDRVKYLLILEAMQTLSTMSEGPMKINESQMDKAELALAAKSVLTDLQHMAEKVAKLEAEGILPLLDGIKAQFSPEMAESLNTTTNEQLRLVMDALKNAKDAIGTQILNMERVVSGEEPVTDMSQNAGVGDSDLTAELDATPGESSPETDSEPSTDDIEAALSGGVGRTAKESFNHNAKMLAESKNPDRFVAAFCAKTIKEGMSVKKAVAFVAEQLGIDQSDVVDALQSTLKK